MLILTFIDVLYIAFFVTDLSDFFLRFCEGMYDKKGDVLCSSQVKYTSLAVPEFEAAVLRQHSEHGILL